jgi:hypothetical protein
MKEKVVMPDQTLHEVAFEARHAVNALTDLVDHQRKVARRRLLWVTLIAIPLAMFVAMFITISTISVCFLGSDTEYPGACDFIPGYKAALESDQDERNKFEELFEITEENQRRIEELEANQ